MKKQSNNNMQEQPDIITLIKQAEEQARKESEKAVIIQPGALGDCILTLGLAVFLKEKCKISSVDFIGHSDYIDYFVSRSCIDGIKSSDSIDFHKLFVQPDEFFVEDGDRLLDVFAGYNHILSFMSSAEDIFEQNLISLVNCTHSAQITSLNLKSPADYNTHITKYYIEQYIRQNPDLDFDEIEFDINRNFLEIKPDDIETAGRFSPSQSDFVLIAPGSGGKHKCWPLENFGALAMLLDKSGLQALYLLGYAEQERFSPQDINILNESGTLITDLTIPQILGLLGLCRFYIGNDSGISHLASAAGIKTLVLFGPTNANIYRPMGDNVEILNLGQTFSEKSSYAVSIILNRIRYMQCL